MLEKVIKETLKSIENELFLIFLVPSKAEEISSVLSKGEICDREIEFAIEGAVLNQAKKDYQFLTSDGKNMLPYLTKPEFFAYALSKNYFTRSELKKINYSYFGSKEKFLKDSLNLDLIPSLRKRLLNPYVYPNWDVHH